MSVVHIGSMLSGSADTWAKNKIYLLSSNNMRARSWRQLQNGRLITVTWKSWKYKAISSKAFHRKPTSYGCSTCGQKNHRIWRLQLLAVPTLFLLSNWVGYEVRRHARLVSLPCPRWVFGQWRAPSNAADGTLGVLKFFDGFFARGEPVVREVQLNAAGPDQHATSPIERWEPQATLRNP